MATAFDSALWHVSDVTGIRPEWQLPVLSLESGLDPQAVNSHGCVGLNQFCPSTFRSYVDVPTEEYRRWSPSQQISGPILSYWRDAQRFGPIRSATKLMLAQLGQSLHRGASLDTVLFRRPSPEYEQNRGFDTTNKGSVTVRDVSNAIARHAEAMRGAIARAYQLRPGERPLDPVYGNDFAESPRGGKIVIVALGIMVAAAGYELWRRS